MPRYIDADALIEAIKNELWDWDSLDGITSATVLKQTITDIQNAPTPDVVEVVRCKDCKHRVFEHGSYACDLDTWDFRERGRNAEDDKWFCADGERE